MTDTPDTRYGAPCSDSRGQVVLHPARASYVATVKALLDDTFTV